MSTDELRDDVTRCLVIHLGMVPSGAVDALIAGPLADLIRLAAIGAWVKATSEGSSSIAWARHGEQWFETARDFRSAALAAGAAVPGEPTDLIRFSSERLEATDLIDELLAGRSLQWARVDNAHNDLLREVVKQLVGRLPAAPVDDPTDDGVCRQCQGIGCLACDARRHRAAAPVDPQ